MIIETMIEYSYNIIWRGLSSKKKKISYLLKSSKVVICFLQETKLTTFDEPMARSILWEKSSLSVNYSFTGPSFVGINVDWKGSSCNLVNIYAACRGLDHRKMWRRMVELKRSRINVEWCLGGDFDVVCNREERLGGGVSYNSRDMEEFKNFIEEMDVIDIPSVGGKFTWYKDNGKAMIRLDIVFLSSNMIEIWNVLHQRICEREVSDHTPLWLKCGVLDWGPKLFRFNNAWLKHEDFRKFNMEEWANLEVAGRGDFVLIEKIKELKSGLRVWNPEVFG